MPNVVGVRFKRASRIYYFDPGELGLQVSDDVIVETTRGTEIGRVIVAPTQVLENEVVEPLRPVLRKAEPRDLQLHDEFKAREDQAFDKAKEKIAQRGLPMKLVRAEYNFDGSRLTFFFTSEGRVDFRQLVRDLASTFHTRIELRQIGVRDQAKLIGGLGCCGRSLCCASFLSDFAPVSIKMAKDQSLPLNPMKISGVCGRLLCCLGYENEGYCAARASMPAMDDIVNTPTGPGKVVGLNVLKETVTVQLESQAIVEHPASAVTVLDTGEGQRQGPARRRRQ
ncbi:MAG: stage 0 sporulation family protein [Chloroflexi bacterium]|nr:stage 0 sporulation family protein [Chloroflexota bacterium]